MSEAGVLGELMGLCDELLNVVLDFPISARQYNDANATQSATTTTGRFVDLLQWLHYEEWLSEQVKLYEAKRIVMKGHGSNGNHDDDDDDDDVDLNGAAAADVDNRNWGRREKQLFNDIVQLQEDTFARSSQLLANKEIVKRVLEADLIHELAFRRANDGGGDDGEFEPQTELDYAAILLRHSAAKQRELIALTAQLERIESDIENVERANVELRASNRSLVERFLPHAFVSRAQQSRPANAHELLAQANRSVDTCIVLRNVLKQLVFESGVNWALDATLRRVILEPDEKLLL